MSATTREPQPTQATTSGVSPPASSSASPSSPASSSIPPAASSGAGKSLSFAWPRRGSCTLKRMHFELMLSGDELRIVRDLGTYTINRFSWEPCDEVVPGGLLFRLAPARVVNFASGKTERVMERVNEFVVDGQGKFVGLLDVDKLVSALLEDELKRMRVRMGLQPNDSSQDHFFVLPDHKEILKQQYRKTAMEEYYIMWRTWVQIWTTMPADRDTLVRQRMMSESGEIPVYGKVCYPLCIKVTKPKSKVAAKHLNNVRRTYGGTLPFSDHSYKHALDTSLYEGVLESDTLRPHLITRLDSHEIVMLFKDKNGKPSSSSMMRKRIARYLFCWDDIAEMQDDQLLQEAYKKFHALCKTVYAKADALFGANGTIKKHMKVVALQKRKSMLAASSSASTTASTTTTTTTTAAAAASTTTASPPPPSSSSSSRAAVGPDEHQQEEEHHQQEEEHRQQEEQQEQEQDETKTNNNNKQPEQQSAATAAAADDEQKTLSPVGSTTTIAANDGGAKKPHGKKKKHANGNGTTATAKTSNNQTTTTSTAKQTATAAAVTASDEQQAANGFHEETEEKPPMTLMNGAEQGNTIGVH